MWCTGLNLISTGTMAIISDFVEHSGFKRQCSQADEKLIANA
jgi:hypothetical protein